MPPQSPRPGCLGITRRGFLLGSAAGLAAGAPLGWLALKGSQWYDGHAHAPSPFTGKSTEVRRPALAMPGPFPGRVVEVRHPGAVADAGAIDADAVRGMMRQGMRSL